MRFFSAPLDGLAAANAQLVHLRTRFGERGDTPFLLGTAWTPARLARRLGEATPRLCVLHAAEDSGASALWRALLLRNAFAARLFEVTDVAVLVAVGPFGSESDEPMEIVTEAVVNVMAGRLAPGDLARDMRRRFSGTGIPSSCVALFCDAPDVPLAPAPST
jgi:hypothetical protein